MNRKIDNFTVYHNTTIPKSNTLPHNNKTDIILIIGNSNQREYIRLPQYFKGKIYYFALGPKKVCTYLVVILNRLI